MKIAIFSAVPEEVAYLSNKVNFTGIGRENATHAALTFIDKYRDEDFLVLNVGTVGSHTFPVGTILSISEITSAGRQFYQQPMLLDRFETACIESLPTTTLFSSDSFVSPHIYTANCLEDMKCKAHCFDMESSALYSIMKHYKKQYVSFKIVSDQLDVTLDVWYQRVANLSVQLADFLQKLFTELGDVEFLT